MPLVHDFDWVVLVVFVVFDFAAVLVAVLVEVFFAVVFAAVFFVLSALSPVAVFVELRDFFFVPAFSCSAFTAISIGMDSTV